jgi:predicted transcriptional regulator
MSTTMGVKFDDGVRKRLKALAAAQERTPHWLVKKAVAEFLERGETRERERLAEEQAWREFQTTGEAIPHAEVNRFIEAWVENERGAKPPPLVKASSRRRRPARAVPRNQAR